MRASRLLSLLFVLQRRQTATAQALAVELEVSLRTLYRDVASLMASGVPIYTDRGPGGGIRLMPGWRARLDGLTADEVGALALSGAPQALHGLGLAAVAVGARAKLDASLPEELRGRAARIRERFMLDAPGWFRSEESSPFLAAVAGAVWNSKRLDVVYAGKRRRIDPLGLVLKAGTWYLIARHRKRVKTFRMSRLQSARAGRETFERPAGFELEAHWRESARAFDASLARYPCELKLSARGLKWLPELAPGDHVREQLAAAPAADAAGFHTLELRLESETVACSQLIGLGDEVEVLAPASLRRGVAELAGRIVARHRPMPQRIEKRGRAQK